MLSLRLVFADGVGDQPFGRILIGDEFVELGKAKPAVPLAVYLGQLALCADQPHAVPILRCDGDASFGGRLYRAFSMGTWPRWAGPLSRLRAEGLWPPWRLDRGWLRPKPGLPLRVKGACRTTDRWLGWRDDQRIEGIELWSLLVDLVGAVGWSVDDLDPRLRADYQSAVEGNGLSAPHDELTPVGDVAPDYSRSETPRAVHPLAIPEVAGRHGGDALGRRVGPNAESVGDPGPYADLVAAFASRTEFASAYSPFGLFGQAHDIQAAGLSLNMLCQQIADHQLRRLIERGTSLRCLFLDPDGAAVKVREDEEGMARGQLSALTALNIDALRRLRDSLPAHEAERIAIAVYDQTVRFNVTFIDERLCVVQPYLPGTRGVDSPTFVVERMPYSGLYLSFQRAFAWTLERSRPL